jgi:hypothetical protein
MSTRTRTRTNMMVKFAMESNLMVQTIDENKKGYNQRQFEDAKKARKLFHIIGYPTVENFKAILRQNIIRNCPVTVRTLL